MLLPSLLTSCSNDNQGKLGVALVGLGKYSTNQLAPALQQTDYCYLAGIVSGSAEKRSKWSEQYNLPDSNIYTYDTFDLLRDNKSIDIVYIVLPNALHKDYVIRAAEAGKHVICEKPMGLSSVECREMIEACKKHGVKLFMGYRLHFDLYHQYLMSLRANNHVQSVSADLGYVIKDYSEWRMKKALAGGGALMNLGVYCIQSACYITGMQPTHVTAQTFTTKPDSFSEVEETITFQLHFQTNVTTQFSASHAIDMDRIHVDMTEEQFYLSRAFYYNKLGEHYSSKSFAQVNQQALQMDHFANCIKTNTNSPMNGEMGLRDLQIIEAVYEAAANGCTVTVRYS